MGPAAEDEEDGVLPASLIDRPRAIILPASPSALTHVVESAGLPHRALPLDAGSLPFARALAQWRLDLPDDLGEGGASPPGWLHVCRALLRRGAVTRINPTLAAGLRDLVGRLVGSAVPDAMPVAALEEAAGHPDLRVARLPDFTNDEERAFAHDLLPLAGAHWPMWTLGQITLGSLTGDPADLASQQRVDFMIAHPRGLRLVVEVDGQDHLAPPQQELDQRRDESLRRAGFEVVRVPAEEVRARRGPALDPLLARLRALAPSDAPPSPLAIWARMCTRAHQAQIAVLEWLNLRRDLCAPGTAVGVDLDPGPGVPAAARGAWAQLVLADLTALVADVSAARGEGEAAVSFSPRPAGPVRLLVSGEGTPRPGTGVISDVFVPVPASAHLPTGSCPPPPGADAQGCRRVLERLYGHADFRPGQWEAVSRALRGLDSVVLLPTGSGKSIAFQLAAMLRGGMCLVVDPILSLVDDQLDNLRRAGIDRAQQITGNLTPEQRAEALAQLQRGEFLFCYVAPERLQDAAFREGLTVLSVHSPAGLIAIDEAHCVSEWGHQFRPAYLNLARNARRFCAGPRGAPPLMALTGTASHSVLKDVQRELGIESLDAIITPATFDRSELSFQAVRCASPEKPARLKGVLTGLPGHFGLPAPAFFSPRGPATSAGLVFCPHTNGDLGVMSVAAGVAGMLGAPVLTYSGKPPRGVDETQWAATKRRHAAQFKDNAAAVLVCTSAFGMGIDKPNVRYTVHYNLPASIESFYQEAGRAGRDGRAARCVVIFSNDDPERARYLLDPGTPTGALNVAIKDTSRPESDDITRMLFFHTESFRGADAEVGEVEALLAQLPPLGRPVGASVRFTGTQRLAVERALHRLVLLGVVADYTVDWPRSTFNLTLARCDQAMAVESLRRYVHGYERQRAQVLVKRMSSRLDQPLDTLVRVLVRELVGFVYDLIERGRRRNLAEMLRLLEQSRDGEEIRQGILFYLERSQFSSAIEALREQADAGVGGVAAIADAIRSSLDAARVAGETARALGDAPEFPGFLLLRAAAEALNHRGDLSVVQANARAAVRLGESKYGLTAAALAQAVVRSAEAVHDARPEAARTLVLGALSGSSDGRAFARAGLQQPASPFTVDLSTHLLTLLGRQLEPLCRSTPQ